MPRALLPFALLLLAAPIQAQRDISIEHFDSNIVVRTDASIDVTETLRIRFDGSWNGIERDYSLDHETCQGRVRRLRMDVRSVTDGAGSPLRVEEESISQGRRLRIWVTGAVDATRTVVVHYTVPDVIRFCDATATQPEWDELYWDVTGNGWEMYIGRVTTTVSLPGGAENVQAWAYTGATGTAGQDAEVEVVGNEVRVASTRAFSPYEGLTVSTTFAPGVVDRPGATDRFLDWVRLLWPLALPLFAFVGMYRVWNRHGRDPVARAIAVQYEPPDLSAVEVGTLVDHSVEMHDITSMLVDLAVRGYVVIEEREEKKLLGLFSDEEYWFHLRRPRSEWSDLRPQERKFLTALFASPSTESRRPVPGPNGLDAHDPSLPSVKLDDLKNKFYRHIEGIRSAVYASLIQRGMYTKRPDHARAKWLMAAAGVGVLAFVGSGFMQAKPWIADPLMVAFGLGLSALIVAGFALLMPTRTEAGARAREAALGFKEFLSRVEQDRFQRMITSPELFEKFLPYAMAFQVEERWAKAFQDLYRQPPDWYHGRSTGGGFDSVRFARSMGNMSSQAQRTMASSPSSSSSSGSGGGGFSGGGSGGGGGRGF